MKYGRGDIAYLDSVQTSTRCYKEEKVFETEKNRSETIPFHFFLKFLNPSKK